MALFAPNMDALMAAGYFHRPTPGIMRWWPNSDLRAVASDDRFWPVEKQFAVIILSRRRSAARWLITAATVALAVSTVL